MRRKVKLSPILALGGLAALAGGCGYSFHGSHSPLVEKQGIHRVFIEPLVNDTFHPGVETTLRDDLQRAIEMYGYLRVVSSRGDADAVLSGHITAANLSPGGQTSAAGANPVVPALTQTYATRYLIPTSYGVALACSLSLDRVHNEVGKPSHVWSSTLSRGMSFQASNALDVPGTTSALVNNSEFDRALGTLAKQMATDAHEAMVDAF